MPVTEAAVMLDIDGGIGDVNLQLRWAPIQKI
jgi:hypothetical protein